jgi:hypothetical protein
LSKINSPIINPSITSINQTFQKLSLPALLSFQDAWAQNKDGARVFKVTRGDQFLIMATLRVQAQPMSNPILPVNVGLEFVHIYIKDTTVDKKVESDLQQQTCQNTGDYTVQRQYRFETQSMTIPGKPPFGQPTTVQAGGQEGLHMFQIIADVTDQTQSAYVAVSPWIYVRII